MIEYSVIESAKRFGMQKSGRIQHDSKQSNQKQRLDGKPQNVAMTIVLPPDINGQLEEAAEKDSRSRAGMARLIIETYFRGSPGASPRSEIKDSENLDR